MTFISPFVNPFLSPFEDTFSSLVYQLRFSYDKLGRTAGNTTHSNTRTAIATLIDHEGVLRTAKSGETRIEGARRVENLATALTTHSVTVVSGRKYQISTTGASGSTVELSDAETGTLTNDGTNQIGFDTEKTAGSTTLTLTITGTLTGLLVEDVTGQANTSPSDIIAHDTDHGWGANGVAYYDYENGNTISGGVVTNARGSDITGISVLVETASTNEALWCRDFTNAAWSKTNITAAKDAVGLDGQANSASTLTASAGNGTVFQTITKASAENTTSFYVRRKTGTGTIEITDDGGSTYTDITSSINSSTYTRVKITNTVTNPSIGFRVVTSGDEIEVDYSQLEELADVTSAIETTTTAATRDIDAIQFDNAAAWFPSAEGLSLIKVTPQLDWATALQAWYLTLGSNRRLAYRNNNTDGVFTWDGTNQSQALNGITPGTAVTIASIWSTTLNKYQIGYYKHNEETWAWDATPSAFSESAIASTLNLLYHTVGPVVNDVEKVGGVKIYSSLPESTLAATQTWIENNAANLIS